MWVEAVLDIFSENDRIVVLCVVRTIDERHCTFARRFQDGSHTSGCSSISAYISTTSTRRTRNRLEAVLHVTI